MSDQEYRSQDIGGREGIYVPIYIDTSGIYRRMQSGAILDIAGVSSQNFTVGGKAIMLADGTSSDGSNSLDLQAVYQNTVPIAGTANIKLVNDKSFAISDSNGNSFVKVDAITGKVTIDSELLIASPIVRFDGAYHQASHLNILPNAGNRAAFVIEPLSGINFSVNPVNIKITQNHQVPDFSIDPLGRTFIRELIVDSIDGVDFDFLSDHLSPGANPFKHFANEISFEQTATSVYIDLANTSDVNYAINEIISSFSTKLDSISSVIDLIQDEDSETGFFQRITTLEENALIFTTETNERLTTIEENIAELNTAVSSIQTANVVGINFEQFTSAAVWTIPHMSGSSLIQFTIYDDDNRLVWPDDAIVLDANHFVLIFSSPQSGRAILSCLIPPVINISN